MPNEAPVLARKVGERVGERAVPVKLRRALRVAARPSACKQLPLAPACEPSLAAMSAALRCRAKCMVSAARVAPPATPVTARASEPRQASRRKAAGKRGEASSMAMPAAGRAGRAGELGKGRAGDSC